MSHTTFEQTCLSGFPPAVGEFGKGTGELWIVDLDGALPVGRGVFSSVLLRVTGSVKV